MKITEKWKLSEEEKHKARLDLQKAEREIKRLGGLNDVFASLSVTHPVEPEAISDALGLQPDSLLRQGDSLTSGQRFDIQIDQTDWSISTDGEIRDNQPESHVKWLIEKIHGHLPALRQLQRTGGRAKITIHANSWSRLQYVDMSAETLQFLARYHLDFTMVVNYQNSEHEY